MTTTTDPTPITQVEYIQAEFAYLLRNLGNGTQSAVSIATLHNELRKLARTLNIDNETVSGRITTHNGRYYRWAYLDQ